MKQKRLYRITEEIKRDLSLIIKKKLNDPRISEHITISHVDLTEDLKFAKIYISSIESMDKRDKFADILNNAKGFLRTELSKVLKTRTAPELKFYVDETIENGVRINKLLNDIKKSEVEND
ncbi:MAG: 30S ribosome-binding factor RbfA [Eubacteriales bacterium]